MEYRYAVTLGSNDRVRSANVRRTLYCFHSDSFGRLYRHDGWAGGSSATHSHFCRKHERLKGRTPAMASGLADKVWTIRELVGRVAG